jgi:hypothetical protein
LNPHFGQAEGTPFTVAPLAELLSWEGDTAAADLILRGEYTNAELDDITQLLLKHCQSVSEPDVIKPELTLEEFTGKLRIWRESTSTSPSGRHLGHYKAVCRPIAYACESHECADLEDSCLALLQAAGVRNQEEWSIPLLSSGMRIFSDSWRRFYRDILAGYQ